MSVARTGAVILAAGEGARMGGVAKALLPIAPDGSTFLQRIVDTLAQAAVDEIVVVIGPPHGQRVREAAPANTRCIVNSDPKRGMFSSVQIGVAALGGEVARALIWPVDTPFVAPATVAQLLATSGEAVVPTFEGRGGHPILVPRSWFADLTRESPPDGLRGFMRARAVRRLEVGDAQVLRDVDVPTDY
jgi:CTP:molybdopterin cytidylyltransferase MocA